jgi:hypothetical protein
MDGEINEFINDKRYSMIDEKFPNYYRFPDYYKCKRFEILLRPGEKIFIPASWWHFVHSEDPDPETGLNVAVNFWFKSKNSEGAKLGWHNIDYDKVMTIINKQDTLSVSRSKLGYFPPNQFAHRYNGKLTIEKLAPSEFLGSKNKEFYVAQNKFHEIDEFFENSIEREGCYLRSQIWINFGNTFTLPHWDGDDNWLCQLKGTRRVIIAPNEESLNMYPINRYDNRLLKKIETSFGSHPYIHFYTEKLSDSVITEILDALDTNPEVHIECKDLSLEFLKHIFKFNLVLEQNGCGFNILKPNLRCSIFHIKRWKKDEQFKTDNDTKIIMIWAVTNMDVHVGHRGYHLDAGQGLIFPNTWLLPMRFTRDCIIATPYKDETV